MFISFEAFLDDGVRNFNAIISAVYTFGKTLSLSFKILQNLEMILNFAGTCTGF